MIARLLQATLWLLVGHAALAGVYWTLINVPESNVVMLGVSAALVLGLVAGAAVVEAIAVLRLGTDEAWRRRGRLAVGSIPAFLVALLVRIAFSWVCHWLTARHDAHSGEIDAWFIAHGDWTQTAWVHRAIRLTLYFVRDVIGTSLAVGVFAAGVLGSFGDVLRLRWIAPAFRPTRLLVVTVAVVGLIWLPWQASSWHPQSLPPTVVQPLFAAVKLGLIAAVMHIGWAIVLWSATPRRAVERLSPEPLPATEPSGAQAPTG